MARARMRSILALFEDQLSRSQDAGGAYLLGDSLTALDIYLATFLTPVVGVSESECPGLRSEVARAFDYLREQPEAQISAALAAHRELVFRRHLAWPIQL
jgi:glutathione S-transferase